MTTPLTKTLKRELKIKDKAFVITLTPETLKITQKGKRKGLQLKWEDLVSGEAALAVALNASVAQAVDLPANAKSRRRRSRK